jgi:hypothetical protein
MERYENVNQGDVKPQETLKKGTFAKQKNYKCQTQSITITMRIVKYMHKETNCQNNNITKTQIGILLC